MAWRCPNRTETIVAGEGTSFLMCISIVIVMKKQSQHQALVESYVQNVSISFLHRNGTVKPGLEYVNMAAFTEETTEKKWKSVSMLSE